MQTLTRLVESYSEVDTGEFGHFGRLGGVDLGDLLVVVDVDLGDPGH